MNLKMFMATAALAIPMAAGAQYQYQVNGNFPDLEGKYIYLSYGSRTENKLDSALVKNGICSFSFTDERPFIMASVLSSKAFTPGVSTSIFMEPGTMTVSLKGTKMNHAVVKGSKTQDEYNDLISSLGDTVKIINNLNEQYYETAPEKRDSLRAAMDLYLNAVMAARKNFYKTHPNSYLSPYFMIFDLPNMDYETMKGIYDGFSERVKKYSPYCQEIASEVETLSKVRPGCPAPDFTANDINGKPFTMSSLKGKVVVIDFWASWCVPCRKSNPHMLELYKKYHDKGLEFVFVSDDDSNPDKWKSAVAKDQLLGDGFHHVLRGLKWDKSKGVAGMDKTNDISDKYAIHLLPTKYIIDRDGNIVSKIDSEEEEKMDSILAKMFK